MRNPLPLLNIIFISTMSVWLAACGGGLDPLPVADSDPPIDCGMGISFDIGGTNGYGYEQAVNTSAINLPTDIAFIPGSSKAFLVISQSGSVYYFDGGCDPVNSLMSGDVGITVIPPGGEQGLLNLEFHPNYALNGYVFFYHSSVANDTNSISRATLSFDGSGNMVLEDTVRIIDFKKNVSASNHNGGGMVFAPDGTLLASVGDGGSGGASNGQLDTNLLGVVARINPSLVTAVGGYSIPADGNMFAATNPKCSGVAASASPCPEILAIGLRNPFRLSITGNIVYLGDVGSAVEEINSFDYTGVNNVNPVNFGWTTHDGFAIASSIPGYRNPIVYYNRSDSTANAFRAEDPEGSMTGAASIIIGDIYNGSGYNGELNNRLFFAEFYDGFVRAVGVDSSGDITDTDGVPGMHIIHHGQVSSMVSGPDGYIYFTTLFSPAMVYRLRKP